MFTYASLAAALIAGSALVHAQVVPTAPGPGDVFKQGGKCTFTWTPDTTGVWKQMNVELMTGSNTGMVHLTTVTTVDGTDAATTSFSYDCPEVTPNSAIYFYQFSTSAAPTNLTWTTRFAIAAADGTTSQPTESTQPSGDAIPWGTGALVDPSTAVAAPPYILGQTSSTGASSAAAGSSGTSSPAAPASNTAAATGTGTGTGTTSKMVSTHSSAPAAPTTSAATSGSNSSSAATDGKSGALAAHGVDSLLVRAGVALGAAAAAFAVAF